MFEICEIKNKTEYNPLLISKQTPFTQSWFYGEWQEMMGRKIRRFEIRRETENLGFFQVIKYPMPFSQNILYIPHGPVLKEISYLGDEFLKEFRDKLSEIVKEENAIFARFDLYFHNCLPSRHLPQGENYGSKENLNKFFKKVPVYAYRSFYFQPKFEWLVDLTKTEEEILNGMHPNNRYNIRLARKRGVEVKIIGENFQKYFSDFYRLLKETARRGDFNLHPKNYYQNIFETLASDNTFLVLAKHDDKILTINLILLFGDTAYFLFGGSSGEHKNLMAPHLSHWQGIIEAKNSGYKFYNFGGVSGNGGKELEGVSFFKKRFGGEIFEYSDSYDIVVKPFWYYLYNLRKKIKACA